MVSLYAHMFKGSYTHAHICTTHTHRNKIAQVYLLNVDGKYQICLSLLAPCHVRKTLSLWLVCLSCSWRKPMPHTWYPFRQQEMSTLPVCFCGLRTFLQESFLEWESSVNEVEATATRTRWCSARKNQSFAKAFGKPNGDWLFNFFRRTALWEPMSRKRKPSICLHSASSQT